MNMWVGKPAPVMCVSCCSQQLTDPLILSCSNACHQCSLSPLQQPPSVSLKGVDCSIVHVYASYWLPCCRLYETVHSLQPEVLEHIPQAVQPFCLAEGMTFGKPQFSHGSWKGYLVGVVGDVAAEEDNVLWPNRVCMHDLLFMCVNCLQVMHD